jgi:16S rRNA (uracil1498-N3)-methyltransferase
MHRFYLPPDQCDASSLCLSGPEAHHALRVLRIRPGETVTVLDGAGRQILCKVGQSVRDLVPLSVIETRTIAPPAGRITLLQAIPKGKIIESVIQKATELGAFRIVPLLSERAVVHLESAEASRKAAKWQGVAIEAIKQSGAAWLPKVEPPVTPEQLLARNEKFELPLFASLQEGSRHPRVFFDAFREREKRQPTSLCVWVGPEGDFSPGESELIKAHGGLPITLGSLVLRVETAATYCLSIINYELSFTAPLD